MRWGTGRNGIFGSSRGSDGARLQGPGGRRELSDPLVVQNPRWMRDVFIGTFGHSFFRFGSVADMIPRRGLLTAGIAFIPEALSWLVGIPVALVSAPRPTSFADDIGRFVSIPL
jgi:peptide/nickel transport system permease protein